MEPLRSGVEQAHSAVRRHKAAIRHHRERLQAWAAKLARLKAQCREVGITVEIIGEEETHGQERRKH